MQRSVRENIALPFSAPPRAAGARSTSAASAGAVDGAIERLQIDTRAAARGPAPVGRQPAEGDDRPLGGRRRPHDAVLRPDARHRHPARSSRSTSCSATWPRRAPRSCSTRPSSRRSSSSATGRSSSSAAAWPVDDACRRRDRRRGGADAGRLTGCRGGARPSRRRAHRRSRRPGRAAAMSARHRDPAALRRQRLGRAALALGLLGSWLLLVFTKLIQPSYGARRSRASRSRSCRSPSPPPPRRSSSSPAASTCRSAR